jgi:hypothetical protein
MKPLYVVEFKQDKMKKPGKEKNKSGLALLGDRPS